MGAGKSTLGPEAARRLGRDFVELDRRIEAAAGKAVADIFAEQGEAEFRGLEEQHALETLRSADHAVIEFGGGAVENEAIRAELARRAFVVQLDVAPDEAWERVRETGRPLAADEAAFRALYERRQSLYMKASDAAASDLDGVILAAAGIHVEAGSLEFVGRVVPAGAPVALVTDPHVAGIHGAAVQLALGDALISVHEVPAGEQAKSVAVAERLWHELRIPRTGVIVALGGGSVTDLAGFVAATHLRGVPWIAVPTTLVGQVDAAIGGKTGIDLPEGKNLVGAFHWPGRTVTDPAALTTLPEREWTDGMAEVVKTALLAGEPLWELSSAESVRRCAAFKAAVCLRDPYERGERAILNLGHTFAHALEAGARYGVTHGAAVALGLTAALRLSGRSTEVVERILDPRPVPADRDRAWAALQRDKKRGLVLLDDEGPRWDVQLPEEDVRRALDELIAD
jgi:shikimate kinase/3-dehydroquinate synthase